MVKFPRMAKLIFLLVLFSSTFLSTAAFAYPDFISYGYNTCISCHYNSHGNGPLTDYGRALFSQEIAARPFIPKSVDDETLASYSQFIPGVDLPFWIRPGLKTRYLWMKENPGGGDEHKHWIRMQRDVNVVFSADQDSRTIVVINYGMTPEKDYDYYGDGTKHSYISREHYIRLFPLKKLLLAAGLMDIAYGIRTGDHTSLARDALGLGEDDQVHGVMAEWFEEKWDFTLHGFVGNKFEPAHAQRQGASMMFEYLTSETNKLGFSAVQANSDDAKQFRVALHDRLGIPNVHGSSIITELGYRGDRNNSTKASSQGMYGMLQSIIRLTRGYNIQTAIERYQNGFKNDSDERSRWTLGLLMFPFQRTELRMGMVQYKNYNPNLASQDVTELQGQLHVSW